MINKTKDLKKMQKREKTFATLAHKEGIEDKKRSKKEAKEGFPISAKDSRWEAKIDEKFSKIRKKKAK